jgi:hypothetical protein
VRTTHGDDFLVDAEASRITLGNELGTFSPWLTECRRIEPLGDPTGDWRVELDTGTVLVGPLAESELVLALPMGPEEVTVPLSALASLQRGAWGVPMNGLDKDGGKKLSMPEAVEPAAAPALQGEQGWFRNEALRSAKH